jgi:hypothetical protein
MQSCASAAKLRSGGPILPVGTKAKGLAGGPPSRTVTGVPSQAQPSCNGVLASLRTVGHELAWGAKSAYSEHGAP